MDFDGDRGQRLAKIHGLVVLVPPNEERQTLRITGAVGAISVHIQMFADASALFDYAEDREQAARADQGQHRGGSPTWLAEQKKRQMAISWMNMACRDGAMQLSHIEKILKLIRKKMPPTLSGIVGLAAIDAAIAEFEKHFPNAKDIRDAASHSMTEFLLHDPPDHHQVDNIIFSTVAGRNYVVTIKKNRHKYELGPRTLKVLQDAYERFIDAFAPAVAQITLEKSQEWRKAARRRPPS
jgi:hypothetical protein